MQVNFNELAAGMMESLLPGSVEDSSSRYEEPDAEGTRPVRRKILRKLFASRVRVGVVFFVSGLSEEANTGAEVPPGGAFVRRRSVMAKVLAIQITLEFIVRIQ